MRRAEPAFPHAVAFGTRTPPARTAVPATSTATVVLGLTQHNAKFAFTSLFRANVFSPALRDGTQTTTRNVCAAITSVNLGARRPGRTIATSAPMSSKKASACHDVLTDLCKTASSAGRAIQAVELATGSTRTSASLATLASSARPAHSPAVALATAFAPRGCAMGPTLRTARWAAVSSRTLSPAPPASAPGRAPSTVTSPTHLWNGHVIRAMPSATLQVPALVPGITSVSTVPTFDGETGVTFAVAVMSTTDKGCATSVTLNASTDALRPVTLRRVCNVAILSPRMDWSASKRARHTFAWARPASAPVPRTPRFTMTLGRRRPSRPSA